MGVRGLKTFVHRKSDHFLCDFKLHDTRLIIDGSNLLYSLSSHYRASIQLNQFGGNDDHFHKIYKDFFNNYEHFTEFCINFFNYLLNCNITPVVVLDGTDDPNDMKLSTTFERMEKQYKRVASKEGGILPLLSKVTFLQVLNELDVAHVACLYEADREIAVLAKKWQCPVLSDDSDFYVYNIESGCISISHTISLIQDRIAAGRSASFLPVKLYQRKMVLKELFKMEEDEYIFPVFATLAGNDYFDPAMVNLTFPRDSGNTLECPARLQNIVDWFNRANFENGETAYQHLSAEITGDKRKQFKASVDSYVDGMEDFAQFNLENFLPCNANTDSPKRCGEKPDAHGTFTFALEQQLSSDVAQEIEIKEVEDAKSKDSHIDKLPSWFIQSLIKCDINCNVLLNIAVNQRLMFRAQFEKLTEISSFACSKDIRRVIYRIILGPDSRDMVEYDRKPSDRLKVKPIDRLAGIPELPELETIPSLSQTERKTILFEAVCGMPYSFDQGMCEASQLLIIMLYIWKKNTQAKESHLTSLVICIIVLQIFYQSGSDIFVDMADACNAMGNEKLEEFKKRMEKHFAIPDYLARYSIAMDVVHAVAQFKACYLHTYYLNQLLRNPVCIPRPGIVLNSALVYNICYLLENNVHPKNMLRRNSPICELYENWMNSIEKLCQKSTNQRA